jgi:rubrerythrin
MIDENELMKALENQETNYMEHDANDAYAMGKIQGLREAQMIVETLSPFEFYCYNSDGCEMYLCKNCGYVNRGKPQVCPVCNGIKIKRRSRL